jgi:hypothetical protein
LLARDGEFELGPSEDLEHALCALLRRVFEESPELSGCGPWAMHSDAETDVLARRISLVIKILPVFSDSN